MRYTNFLKIFEMQYLSSQSHNSLHLFFLLHTSCIRLFDKTVKSHGFLAKGIWKEGKISAIKFLAFFCKEPHD